MMAPYPCTTAHVAGMKLIGYARCSTEAQDLLAQRSTLISMGVHPDDIYSDHGLTGTNRDRPGLAQAMAACRIGDQLAVAKMDRLARSVPDARAILDELTAKGVVLNLGGSVHDPADPIGKVLYGVLAIIGEFEADLTRARTRDGMAIAKSKGRLKGKAPKLNAAQRKQLLRLADEGEHTQTELGEIFGVSRGTVQRELKRDAA